MSLVHVIILALIQGLAELLPVSSSAHVVVAEKLMGLDPSAPDMTLLLVMLHTGTMFAVIVYFWKRWRDTFFSSEPAFKSFAILVIVATIITGIIGEGLIKVLEKTLLANTPHAEVELLFSHLELIAPALAAAGILILIAGVFAKEGKTELGMKQASLIGFVQGLCLPFRGFSRSGATISTGMLAGVGKVRVEDFSFALAVVLTPPVVAREALRLMKASHAGLGAAAVPGLVGMVCAFLAGLLALKWLSGWLENGKWYLFGIYCLVAAGAVEWLHYAGY